MNKKIIITGCIIALLIALGHKKIKKFFIENRYYKYLVNMHIIKPCYISHPDIIKIFAQEGFDYFKEDQEITSNSLIKLEENKNESVNITNITKIPLITHHIYFSNANSAKELDVYFIEKMKTYYNNLNKIDENWQHYIWTNNPALFPNEIMQIKGVTLKSVEEFNNLEAYESLVDVLKKSETQKPYLSSATDLARFMSVQKYGGIYCDLDYEVYDPDYLFQLMHKFDFIGARETIRLDSLYATAFFAAKPNHPILNDAVEKNYRNFLKSEAPEYIKYPCNIYDGILFNATVLMTVSYFSKNNIDGNNDIILPSWMALNKNFARYKNNDCKLSDITKEYFYNQQNHLDSIINKFTENPVIEEENNPNTSSIYYNIDNRKNYKIIGADPMCGTWITQENHRRFHYFNW